MSGEAAPPAYQGVPIPESKDTKVTLLLSIPNVSVNQIYNGEQLFLARGLLELSCIPADPDSYLVLKTGEVEVVLTPDSRVFKKGNDGLYVPWTELPGAILFFDLAACDLEAVETLDTYLVSYTSMPAPETNLRNQLALVDEHGQVVGEIECDNTQDLKRPAIERTDSSKEPVLVDLDHDGHLNVEKFKDSKIVKGGTYVSSGILYGADVLSSSMQKGSEWLNARSPPATKDIEFSSVTKASTRRVHQLSTGVAHVSSKTVGYVGKLAEAAGGKVAGRPKANSKDDTKPGLLSQSAHAIVTILDAFDQGGKKVLGSATDNLGSVVQHRYGSQAGLMAHQLGGSVKNVALVYFDATGVSHRAILKSGIKGGIKARMSDGRQVVLNEEQIKKNL